MLQNKNFVAELHCARVNETRHGPIAPPRSMFDLFRLLLIASLVSLLPLQVSSKPASYIGFGMQTGTPSGDVRAALEPVTGGTSEQESFFDDLPAGIPEDTRPEIVRALSFNRPVRIGVQQTLENQHNAAMVEHTRAYLRKMFGAENLSVYLLSDKDLSNAVRTGKLDFFLVDANAYVLEESLGGVHAVAALWPMTSDTPSAVTASTIFMKKTQTRTMSSLPLGVLTGHPLVATTSASLSGWQAAAGEVVRQKPILFDHLTAKAKFVGPNSLQVVEAVRNNANAVGILSACELERLQEAGSLSLDEFVILNDKTYDGLACRHSTTVYPGWVFGTVNGTEPALRKAMTAVLFGMSGLRYGAEWTMPVSYRSVSDLFYDLKIGPYQDLAEWSLRRVVREHSDLIALVLLCSFLALSYMTAISVLVRRRTHQLRHALEERARIEHEVAQSRQHIANLERTGIVGQMSTIIAHELKQPLGAITNYGNGLLRRLRRGNIDPKSFETALNEVVMQADRASKIVERVRAYAKHDFPPRKVADISIIIENAIQTFRRSRTTEAELTVRMHSRSMAEVDSWEVELAILNLLKNAADAVSTVPDPRIEVALEPAEGDNWHLTVADNGPYVSDEALKKFFMPLQTSKGAAGMGLGLSIVANIAERHAGHIRVDRNGERGVIFTITIPRLVTLTSGETTEEVVMGPEIVSIYEAGGNGGVVRNTVDKESAAVVRNPSASPKTIHTGGLSRVVKVMEDGNMKQKLTHLRGPYREDDPEGITEVAVDVGVESDSTEKSPKA